MRCMEQLNCLFSYFSGSSSWRIRCLVIWSDMCCGSFQWPVKSWMHENAINTENASPISHSLWFYCTISKSRYIKTRISDKSLSMQSRDKRFMNVLFPVNFTPWPWLKEELEKVSNAWWEWLRRRASEAPLWGPSGAIFPWCMKRKA